MKPAELKKLRAALGWSQQRLADELGVQRNTINRWEMGDRRIPPMAERLLTILSHDCHSAASPTVRKKR